MLNRALHGQTDLSGNLALANLARPKQDTSVSPARLQMCHKAASCIGGMGAGPMQAAVAAQQRHRRVPENCPHAVGQHGSKSEQEEQINWGGARICPPRAKSADNCPPKTAAPFTWSLLQRPQGLPKCSEAF